MRVESVEGAGADQLRPNSSPALDHLGCLDHPAPVGQQRQQRRARHFKIELEGVGIEHIHAGDGADLGGALAAFRGLVAQQGVFHRLGIERLAIVEGDTFAKMQHQMGRVLVFIAGRQLRNDLEVRIDVEQFVAEAGEHHTGDIAGAERRIENVRVFANADAQGAVLRLRHRDAAGQC